LHHVSIAKMRRSKLERQSISFGISGLPRL
jgi:hypothetical protein